MIGTHLRCLGFGLACCLAGCVAAAAQADPPATKYWEGAHLAEVRASDKPPKIIRRSLQDLRRLADEALRSGPYSVVDKEITPPSGDKHDYLSYSRYWWPNPDTADGLPFVRRDGEVNRKRVAMGDRVAIGDLCEDVEALTLAAYLFDDQRYAEHATRLLRVWFLDPATRMNPNLNFAQGVPGRADGRAPGVLDSRHFLRVLDGVALLESLDAIDPSEVQGLRAWFSGFLDWLLTSELGRAERRAVNNHGFWYAAQATRIALFVGRDDVARSLLEEVRDRRLPEGITGDGRQPEELKRTLSLHYSLFSLSAIAVTARYGESLGIDLWTHETPSGGGFRKAFEYAGPYVAEVADWRHPMIDRYAVSNSQAVLFYLAASRLEKPEALDWLDRAATRYRDGFLTPLLFEDPRATDRRAE